MVYEFLMCVCGSKEAKKAPERAACEENPDCRQYASRIACARSKGESGNCSDHKSVKHAQGGSATFAEGPNIQLVCHGMTPSWLQ
jgi:hypothetical protein